MRYFLSGSLLFVEAASGFLSGEKWLCMLLVVIWCMMPLCALLIANDADYFAFLLG